jgi:hypothetical protein
MDENPYTPPTSPRESGIPSIGTDGTEFFRVRFLSIWFHFLCIAVALFALFVATFLSFDRPNIGTKAALCAKGFLALIIAESAVAYFTWASQKVYVSDLGIKCGKCWGGHGFIAWDRVVEVTSINLLGIRFLRIYDDGGSPLWLPTCMAKPKLFWPYLLTMAPPGSAIDKAVRAENLVD